MPAAKDFYVAIELGSSKVTGIAGQKKMDGSISVLAVATEDSTSLIRRGTVYNIEKTNLCIRRIIQRLQNQLQTEITLVHVGIGGQSIRTLQNNIFNDFDEATVVSHNIIDTMCDANRATKYPNQIILDVVPQEYKVDLQYQTEPVGIECNRIEGIYLNIIWRETFYRNLCKCFEQEKMPKSRYYIAPLALAENILTDSEMRNGCMLVDLGAGTTTVSIYHKSILRHIATIPIGGWNITKDIASFHIDEGDAEKLKLKHAAAYTNPSEINNETKLSIDTQRTITQRDFINMVEARTEEIIRNVLAQIPAEYEDKLIGGIILTGGVSNIRNLEQALREYSKCENIRIANKVRTSVNIAKQVTAGTDISCTALSLLLKADQISSGRPLSEATSIFSEEKSDTAPSEDVRNRPMVPGEVPTGREREEIEKEAMQKAAQEAEKAKEPQETEEEEADNGNSIFKRMKARIIQLGKTLIEEEEEDGVSK